MIDETIETMLVEDAPSETVTKEAARGKKTAQRKNSHGLPYEPRYDDKVTIILDDNNSIPPTGLPLGRNGESHILRPGIAAEVPLWVLDILDHAIEDAPVVDPTNLQIVGTTPRPRYSYRMVREAR